MWNRSKHRLVFPWPITNEPYVGTWAKPTIYHQHGEDYERGRSSRTTRTVSTIDAVFVMEADVVPVQHYWLDTLIDEAEESPFVILGSKYDGDSWDSFRSSLSLALQHHINGNAIYNTTHPLFQHLLSQLQIEVDTPYHAIPYDYRISQILVEGMRNTTRHTTADHWRMVTREWWTTNRDFH